MVILCECVLLCFGFFSYSEAMTMGKLHKEIGQLIVQSVEDPDKSDSQVIKVNILFSFLFLNLVKLLLLLNLGGRGGVGGRLSLRISRSLLPSASLQMSIFILHIGF